VDGSFNLTEALIAAQSSNGSVTAAEEVEQPTTTLNMTDENGKIIPSRVTNMKEVKMIVLQFRSEHQDNWKSAVVKKYEMDMVERLQK